MEKEAAKKWPGNWQFLKTKYSDVSFLKFVKLNKKLKENAHKVVLVNPIAVEGHMKHPALTLPALS